MRAQDLDDVRIRLEHVLAGEKRRARQEPAVIAHRVVDLQAVAAADHVVLLAMARRSVDAAGARIQRHVRAEDDRHLAIVERMTQLHALQRIAPAIGDDPVVLDAHAHHHVLDERLGQEQPFRTRRTVTLDHGIFELRMHGHRLVGGQRPWRRRPDRHRQQSPALVALDMTTPRHERLDVRERKAHVDGGRVLVLVLDLGLGQGRTAVDAPVHGFGALDEVTVGNDLPQRSHDVRLEGGIHGEVRLLPIAEHAQALEVRPLPRHLLPRVGAAGGAKFPGADLAPGLSDLFLHHELDRQTVAVPTRNVRRVEAAERARLDDDVLQHLVHGMTDVDVAVRVRRPVVQHEPLAPAPSGADPLVQLQFSPAREYLRFAFGQVRAHREIRPRQIQRALVAALGLVFFFHLPGP